MRLIDADSIQIPNTSVDMFENCRNCNLLDADQVREIIDNAPSIEPKRGKWILECDGEGECDNLYRCSECGCEYGCQEYDIPNFCPNCGARMKGADDGTR